MREARRLGRFGVWRSASLVTPELAAGIERLGIGALWLGSSPAGDLAQAGELLDATTTLTLATSIVNMWQDQPEDVARSFARVQRRHPGRFLLGVGAGHREATQRYARPYQALARYVDVLQAGGVPRDSLVLAALGWMAGADLLPASWRLLSLEAEILAALAGALRPNGLMIFTLEHAVGDRCSINYCLELHGRYSHAQAYVKRLLTCSGLRSKIVQAELRTEAGAPVPGLVIRAAKSVS